MGRLQRIEKPNTRKGKKILKAKDKEPLTVENTKQTFFLHGSNTSELPGRCINDLIKDMMAKAQAAIEQRKKQLAITGQSLTTSKGAGIGSMNATDVSSEIQKLSARIQATLVNGVLPPGLVIPTLSSSAAAASATQAKVPETNEEQSKPIPLILDSEGRTVDLSGKEIQLTLRTPTLKANIRAKKREEFKQQLKEKPLEESTENQFFDNRVNAKPFVRTKKAFKFYDQGKFIQLAQRERAKSRLEKLQEDISQIAKKNGISSAAKLAQLEQRDIGVETPDIEWWDMIILQFDRYPVEGEPVKLKEDFITSLVEHPMEMKTPSDLDKTTDLQVFLTKKERKKLRRMNRRETWKEKQEKIRMGLEPPPEPKVRMANLMRVLGTEAVIDPTKMEKHVREQMAKRLKAHEDSNASRKLTPEQRKQRKIKKYKEDTNSTGIHVSVYRVTDLSNGSHKFKIQKNAQQLFLTGTVVLFKDVNVIVVEGGPNQQKKYRRLMMERIKWVEESRSKDAEIEPKCQLVWRGVVHERSFNDIQFKACPSETFAREHFTKHGVQHYWDLAYGKKVLEETEL